MDDLNRPYTTGEIAKLCGVASVTVMKWINSGLLVGYRVPPGMHRRVLQDNLLTFLKAHGMDHVIPNVGKRPKRKRRRPCS